jgi:hypothetical protein
MSTRKVPRWTALGYALLAILLVAGCQTAPADDGPPTARPAATPAAAPAGEEALPRAGGNVRSPPCLPPVPSEINTADYRYW